MSKQAMMKALDALILAESQLDRLWVSHHANRTDLALMHAQDAIAEEKRKTEEAERKEYERLKAKFVEGKE
jgi:hypothetical protein